MATSPCERGRGASPEQGEIHRPVSSCRGSEAEEERSDVSMTGDAGPQAESGQDPTGGSSEATPTPLLRVVSPNATPEEIAALVTVLAALGGDEPAPKRRTP